MSVSSDKVDSESGMLPVNWLADKKLQEKKIITYNAYHMQKQQMD